MILSVSRRTDIPAFYSDWFINRIKEGFVYSRNPVNKKQISKIYLNPEIIDCIVIWTKNPKLFIPKLSCLSSFNYYFHFTVNPYDSSLELKVPKKKEIFYTFCKLSEKIGKHRVIWRYDPILLNDRYNINYHIKYFGKIAEQLHSYTEKCTISFIDMYKKCEGNLRNTRTRALKDEEIKILIPELVDIAERFNLKLETCAEELDLTNYGVNHGRCIDDKLIERIIGKKIKSRKDKNQRLSCGCIESIDIGAYNTCMHNCLYCYANFNYQQVINNQKKHNPQSPLLIGTVQKDDVIIERKLSSVIEKTLFD